MIGATRDLAIPRRPGAWLDAIAIACFALGCAALFRFTAEDAFIVERYARQFVRGHGLVFNVGERVSALTSPLHALLLVALSLVWPAPMVVYKIASAGAALAAILWAGRALFADTSERAVFLSATVASPFVILWSIGGLETPLLVACLTAIATLGLRAARADPSNRALFLFFVLAAVAFLSRHDSVVFVAPLAAGILVRHWRRSVPGVAASLVIAGAWLGFAWWYYGDVLPTSFYLKAVEERPPLMAGVGYEASFAALCLLPLVLVRRPVRRGVTAWAWLSVALFAAMAAVVSSVHMMFGYRFYVPVLPALVAFAMCQSRQARWIGRRGFLLPLSANLALLFVVATQTVNPTLFLPALFAPHYGFLSRLAARGLTYEYTELPARQYGDFVDALREVGRAVCADAETRGMGQSARLATIIAGATALEVPDLYVYDNLVGVRQACPTLDRAEMYRAADYIELMIPRFHSADRQLGTLKAVLQPVTDVAFEFDGGTEHLVAYFNPAATHTPVPARLHDPCPPGRE